MIGDRYAQLAVDAADQLGGYRIGEPSGGRTKAPIWKFSLPKTDGRHVPSQGTDEPGAKGQMAQASSGAGRGGFLSVDNA